MTLRERFLATLNFDRAIDSLPMVEWAAWWDLTIDRWQQEGLPRDIGWDASLEYFGLDKPVMSAGRPQKGGLQWRGRPA